MAPFIRFYAAETQSATLLGNSRYSQHSRGVTVRPRECWSGWTRLIPQKFGLNPRRFTRFAYDVNL
jgi:hypothetical protein